MLEALGRRYSLRALVALCILGVCAVSLAFLGGGLLYGVRDYLWRDFEGHLRTLAEAGVDRVWAKTLPVPSPRRPVPHSPLPVPPDWAWQAEALTHAVGSASVQAALCDDRGILLSSYGGSPEVSLPDARLVLEIRDRFEKEAYRGGWDAGLSRRVSSSWQGLVLPLTVGGQLVGILQVSADRGPSDAEVRTFTLWLLTGSLVALLFGAAVSLLLAQAVTEPLQRLAAASRGIASGRWDARVGLGEGTSEVYRVGADFDAMADRLQRAFEALARFVADASHELHTPLTVISGMAEALDMDLDGGDSEKRRRGLASILRETARMMRITDGLLTLARAEGETQDFQPVRLNSLVEEAAEYAATLSTQHPVHLDLQADLWIQGDPNQLERVLHNLVENAIKYSPGGSPIGLHCHLVGQQVEIALSDRGQGIALEHLPHVFERFYRSDPSRSRRTGGHGLGLAIVRAVVERHGGTVSVQSTLGEGTTVTLRLPLAGKPSCGPPPALKPASRP